MKVLVCGGREYTDYARMCAELDKLAISEIVHGGARGADKLSGRYAQERGIRETVYPADWAAYGRKAGVIRNGIMLKAATPDLVVAFPGGNGTADMVWRARRAAVRVYLVDG